jgi:hypothetical protein
MLTDLQGRERPKRKLWVFNVNMVYEQTAYGYNEDDRKHIWFVLDLGEREIGKNAFESREEAVVFGRSELEAQIHRMQNWLSELK